MKTEEINTSQIRHIKKIPVQEKDMLKMDKIKY